MKARETTIEDLTQARLKEKLDYDPSTGVFTKKNGEIAGFVKPDGNRQIFVDGWRYYAHHLAWLHEYGYLPRNYVKHLNQDRDDNRIDNLAINFFDSSNNTSGIRGVYWDPKVHRWRPQISVDNKMKYFGCFDFDDFDEAVCHRLAAEQCLDWSGCDSSSPAFQYVRDNIQ